MPVMGASLSATGELEIMVPVQCPGCRIAEIYPPLFDIEYKLYGSPGNIIIFITYKLGIILLYCIDFIGIKYTFILFSLHLG